MSGAIDLPADSAAWQARVTVGSELDRSAGPSTTPSAATAVRAPPTTSAATGRLLDHVDAQAVRKARRDAHFAHDREGRDAPRAAPPG